MAVRFAAHRRWSAFAMPWVVAFGPMVDWVIDQSESPTLTTYCWPAVAPLATAGVLTVDVGGFVAAGAGALAFVGATVGVATAAGVDAVATDVGDVVVAGALGLATAGAVVGTTIGVAASAV
jgi:hypothetical protein